MNSFVALTDTLRDQPPSIGVLLSRCDRGQGREDLYRARAPEVLAALSTSARVASIEASVAIEGHVVPTGRAARLAASPPGRIRNRNEKEFAGYRDAMDELMRAEVPETPSIPFVLHLHRRLHAHSGASGGHIKRNDNRIVRYDAVGNQEILFEPVPARDAEFALGELLQRYDDACQEQLAHPLLLMGLMVLDFLAIHPVPDGNGRLARLLGTHEMLRIGYGVARYISIEQRIYDTRNSYYQALQASQENWHERAHDPWPWLSYLIATIADAYADFEARVASAAPAPDRRKQDIAREHILGRPAGAIFRFADLRRELPGISDATIRLALYDLRRDAAVTAQGTGRNTRWQRNG